MQLKILRMLADEKGYSNRQLTEHFNKEKDKKSRRDGNFFTYYVKPLRDGKIIYQERIRATTRCDSKRPNQPELPYQISTELCVFKKIIEFLSHNMQVQMKKRAALIEEYKLQNPVVKDSIPPDSNIKIIPENKHAAKLKSSLDEIGKCRDEESYYYEILKDILLSEYAGKVLSEHGIFEVEPLELPLKPEDFAKFIDNARSKEYITNEEYLNFVSGLENKKFNEYLEHSSFKHEFEEMIAEAPVDTDFEICTENLQTYPKEPDYSDLIRATYSAKAEEKEEAHRPEDNGIKKPQEEP
jgi:hypothetical protein